jgi:hypothetical protein
MIFLTPFDLLKQVVLDEVVGFEVDGVKVLEAELALRHRRRDPHACTAHDRDREHRDLRDRPLRRRAPELRLRPGVAMSAVVAIATRGGLRV